MGKINRPGVQTSVLGTKAVLSISPRKQMASALYAAEGLATTIPNRIAKNSPDPKVPARLRASIPKMRAAFVAVRARSSGGLLRNVGAANGCEVVSGTEPGKAGAE